MVYVSLVDFVLFQFFFLLALFLIISVYLMMIPELIFTVLGLRFHMRRIVREQDNSEC